MKTIKNSIVLLLILVLASCSSDDNGNTPVVSPPPVATLSSINPISGPKTTIVTINGNNFGEDISKVQVFFNEKEGTTQSVNNNQIRAIVPARAFTGLVTLSINGTTLTGPEFTYTVTEVDVSTIAGSTQGYTDGAGTVAQFNNPTGITVDADGNLYVVDIQNHKIRKITAQGVVSTLAGNTRGNADGTGSMAQFNFPTGIAIDTEGNLYVADTWNHAIRKITPQGIVSTIAGSAPGFADGTGTMAQFNFPHGLVTDTLGNIFVADSGNDKIRKITPQGVVSTIAGNTTGYADGTGGMAQFNFPTGIAIDKNDTLYIVERGNNKVRKITPQGVVSTFAGNTSGFADGNGTAAQFNSPTGIIVDTAGVIYVADNGNDKIRKITPQGVVTTLVGSTSGFADGTAVSAQFNSPFDVTIDTDNHLYVSDSSNDKIRKITQE
ncbi:NHL domain-containing protein [Aquimarina megaterium]|uniref:NHL domain-containing protein n=1 Tax=Aquimarina megaterium TaxID=1443666 RepID=UPI0009F5DC16|nr:IPT/TIG domain-containing protein [Aquimarina megaterium]